MRAKTIVDGGDSGTHTFSIGSRKMIYRGVNAIALSTGTGASIRIIARNKDASGEIIDVHSHSGTANEDADLHGVYETEGVEVEEGIFIEVVVANAVAGSVYASLLFDEVS